MHESVYVYTYREKHVIRPYQIFGLFYIFLTVWIKEKEEKQPKVSGLVTSDCESLLLFGRKSIFLMTCIYIAVRTISFW